MNTTYSAKSCFKFYSGGYPTWRSQHEKEKKYWNISVYFIPKRKLPGVLEESRKRVREGVSKGSLKRWIKSSQCGEIAGNIWKCQCKTWSKSRRVKSQPRVCWQSVFFLQLWVIWVPGHMARGGRFKEGSVTCLLPAEGPVQDSSESH